MQKLKATCPAITSAKMDFFREGIFKGTLGIEIEMSGKDRLSFEQVYALIAELRQMPMPKKKVIRFTGTLTDDDSNFLLLLKSLYDYKYELQCVIQNNRIYSWLQWISWIIIQTSDRTVLTAANEIWMYPADGQLQDMIYPPSQQTPFLFLSGRLEVDKIIDFMCQSQQVWALL